MRLSLSASRPPIWGTHAAWCLLYCSSGQFRPYTLLPALPRHPGLVPAHSIAGLQHCVLLYPPFTAVTSSHILFFPELYRGPHVLEDVTGRQLSHIRQLLLRPHVPRLHRPRLLLARSRCLRHSLGCYPTSSLILRFLPLSSLPSSTYLRHILLSPVAFLRSACLHIHPLLSFLYTLPRF